MPTIEQRRYLAQSEFFESLDDDAVLWRYMDLTKLMALLEDRALHFARADLLGDPFEGSMTAALSEPPTYQVDAHGEPVALDDETRDAVRRRWEDTRPFRMALRRWVWVSCWNQSEIESDALWVRYVRAEHGIAIRTTFGRLTRSFGEPYGPDPEEFNMDTAVFVGPVKYVDYERAVWPGTNIFWPFVHKRLSFAYEEEVRAIICQPQTRDGFSDYDAVTPTERLVAVDLAELIESIFVSPVAPGWLHDLVRRICARYELPAEVRQSALSAAPNY